MTDGTLLFTLDTTSLQSLLERYSLPKRTIESGENKGDTPSYIQKAAARWRETRIPAIYRGEIPSITNLLSAPPSEEQNRLDEFWTVQQTALTFFNIRDYAEFLPGRLLIYQLLRERVLDTIGNTILGDRSLELAAGSGTLSQQIVAELNRKAESNGEMLALRADLVDWSAGGLDYARVLAEIFGTERYINTILADMFEFDPGTKRYGLVSSSGVVEHLSPGEQQRFVDKMVETTAPGGYVVVAHPNANSPLYQAAKRGQALIGAQEGTNIYNYPDSVRNEVDIEGLFKAAGLILHAHSGVSLAPSRVDEQLCIDTSELYQGMLGLTVTHAGTQPIHDRGCMEFWARQERELSDRLGPTEFDKVMREYGRCIYAIGKKEVA